MKKFQTYRQLENKISRVVHTPVSPTLGRQRQEDYDNFYTRLLYTVSSRTVRLQFRFCLKKERRKKLMVFSRSIVPQ